MSTESESQRIILFPLRTADYVDYLSDQKKPDTIQLSEAEREQVIGYESTLYEDLSPTLKKMVGIHTIFPEYLITDEGWQMAQRIYEDKNPDLANRAKPETTQEAKELHGKLLINGIDKKLRSEIEGASLRYAQSRFVEGINSDTDLNDLEDPLTSSRVYNPNTLIQKATELREFKKKLKVKDKDTNDSSLEKAKTIIDQIYQRYVNVRLAELYDDAYVALNDPGISDDEKQKIRKLFPGHDTDNVDKRVKTLGRIEKFYQGVDRKEGAGDFPIISESISSAIESKKKVEKTEGNDLYKNHLGITIDAKKYQEIVDLMLKRIGAKEKGWKTEIRNKPGVALETSDKIYFIPENYNRNLPNTIQNIAHEVEGHILRALNRPILPLKLLRNRNTGRAEHIAEAAAVWVEEETVRRLYGIERSMTGTYYTIMKERAKGKSFKHCFMALVKEGKKPSTAFTSTLRVFNNGRIPLDDASKYIVNTEELAYHEPTAERLKELGLEKLLFVPGVDIYTYYDLYKIGMLPLDNIKSPDFIVAEFAKNIQIDEQN